MQKCRRHCASNREPVVIRGSMIFRVCCLALSLLWGLWPTAASAQSKAVWQLSVSDASQTSLVQLGLPEGGRWCLIWNHSVQGFPVTDCFRMEAGQLILDSSHTPDFAAGLGHTRGRGTLTSDDDHGYRIVDMQVPIPNNRLSLRVGALSVNHRIKVDSRVVSLSRLAADKLVEIRVRPAGDKGRTLQ
ncbi:DUF1850 domain-containing protein [Marinobacter algicola]|nr:DUF1850 domain-containing protein [Marinobacter algicola]